MDISGDKRKLIINFASDRKDVTALQFVNDDPEGITIRELSGGMVNYVYRVASKDQKHSVVLKHAEEMMKAINAEKMSLERQTTEYECLKLFNSIVPGCVPVPYCLDREYHIIAMEDLSDRELLGYNLRTKGANPQLGAEWGRVLAKLHQATMKGKVSPEYWQEVCKMRMETSRNIVRNFLFERYYKEADMLAKLPQAALDSYRDFFPEAVKTGLQKKILELFDDERCLLQVDCHWNSVFVKDNSVAMFDFDLATLSHPGVAVGYIACSFVGCFIMSLNGGKYFDERNTLNNEGRKKKLQFQEALRCFLVQYVEESALVGEALSTFISDTALFTGNMICKISNGNTMVQYVEESALVGEALSTFISDTALFTGNMMLVLSIFENMQVFDPAFTVLNQASMFQPVAKVMKTHRDITTVDQLVDAAFDIQMFY